MRALLRTLITPIRVPLRWFIFRVAGIPQPRMDTESSSELRRKVNVPGDHGTAIGELFGEAAFVPDNAQPLSVPLVILAFFNRSGSNLLASQLRDSGAYWGFREQLNHGNVKKISTAQGLDSFEAYIRHIAAPAEAAGVSFGIKATAAQIGLLHYFGVLRLFPAVDVVHIERDDVLRQAISFCIADDTKRWSSVEKRAPQGEPEYDAQRIAWVMEEIAASNLRVRLTCDAVGLRRIPVSYEELAEDGRNTVLRISSALGVRLDPAQLKAPRMEKQAGAINAAFRERFLRELL